MGQEPKKKIKEGDKVRVDTSFTVTRPAIVDTIQLQQLQQIRELDELVEKAKKK